MAKNLTGRQKEVLEAVIALMSKPNAGPPTYRELADRLKLRSLATVTLHLKALSRKGYITVGRGQRAIRILRSGEKDSLIKLPVFSTEFAFSSRGRKENIFKDYEEINADAFDEVPALLVETGNEEMTDAGIEKGDLLALKKKEDTNIDSGDIIFYRIEHSYKLYRVFKEKDYMVLKNCSSKYPPIIVKKEERKTSRIVGKVVGIIKR